MANLEIIDMLCRDQFEARLSCKQDGNGDRAGKHSGRGAEKHIPRKRAL